jgi:thiosulfate/3-mercaptopyruvate sulfurtransferase
MRTHLAVALVFSALAASPLVAAETPREAMLISVEALAKKISDPDLVLLHVGPPAGYERGHLPGARLVRLSDLVTPTNFDVLAMKALRQQFARLGIANTSRIVVYAADGWLSPATRVVFTLHHGGHGARTRFLDGGQDAWVRAGHALMTDVLPIPEPILAIHDTPPLVVDADFVLAHRSTPGFVLVDARNAEFYSGEKQGGRPDSPHRAGHIAGAVSIPFGSVFDDKLQLLPDDRLREVFTRAGVKPGDTIVAYCHIGQQATAVLLAAKALGHDVRLYDGSFEQWSSRPELPVVAGR